MQLLSRQNWALASVAVLLLLFAVSQLYPILLLILLLSLVVVATAPFGQVIQLSIFLLPCLDVFNGTPYMTMSLATLIYLAIFFRYLITQAPSAKLAPLGFAISLAIAVFELLHFAFNDNMVINQSIRWLLLFLCASFILFDKRNYLNFRDMRFAFLVGFLASTAIGLLTQYFHPVIIYNVHIVQRFAGASGDPNNFGLYALLLIFFYLPNVPRGGVSRKTKLLVLAIVTIGSLTVSRTYFLVLTLSSLFYFVLYFRNAIGAMTFRVVIALNSFVLLLTVWLFSGISLFKDADILKRFSGDNLSDLTGARSDIATQYIIHFFDAPISFILFGAGINGYIGYYNNLFAEKYLFPDVVGPHNTLLEAVLSFGFIGMFLWVAYIVFAFKSAREKMQPTTTFRLAFIPMLIFFLYFFSLQNLGKYSSYFILFMIVFNAYRGQRREW